MADDQDDQQLSDDQSASQPDQSDEQNSGSAVADEGSQQAVGDQSTEQQVTDDTEQTASNQGTSSAPDSGDQSSQGSVPEDGAQQSDNAVPAKGNKTGDCSGWERDWQSFAKAVADYYIRTELGATPGLVKTVSCPPPPGGLCWVYYEDGRQIGVSLFTPPRPVIARGYRPLPVTQRCTYDYDCTASGELVFTKLSC